MNTVKRAWLNFARARPDFMFSLAPHKVVALLQEPLPYEEVKVSLAQPAEAAMSAAVCLRACSPCCDLHVH